MLRHACLIAVLVLASGAMAQSVSWQGRPVQEYIESLQNDGFSILYSSDLVTRELRVVEEPQAGGGEAALREVLEAHGLTLRRAGGNRLLVVRADCAPGRLRVRVIDELSRLGLEGADVVTDTGIRGRTGSDGVVVLRCLRLAETALSVSAEDYERASSTATPGRTAPEAVIALDLKPEPLTEIVVFSSVYSLNYEATGSHTFLERELTTRLPDLGDEPIRALERLPGTGGDGLSTKTHVRGGTDSEQLILLDGLRLYEPFHLKDFLSFSSIIDQRAIAGIDFYSAGYPARYGDRMSGVIDIAFREAPEETVTELGLSLFNTSALSAGRFGEQRRGDWLVAARRGNLDLVARALRPEYGTPLTEDLVGHVGFEIGDQVYISANALFSFDKITLADSDEVEQARARYQNAVAWLKAEVDWSDRLRGTTLLSATEIANERTGSVNNPGIVTGSVSDEREFEVISFRQTLVFDPAENLSLRAGVDLKRMQASYDHSSVRQIEAPFDTLLDNTPFRQIDIVTSPDGNQYAGFAEARWRPTRRLIVDAGLRWDRQTYTAAESDEQISPRFNARYDFGEGTTLRLSAGRYHQAQEINELQIMDGVEDYRPASRATHLVAGLEQDISSGGGSLKIELYSKVYHALIPRFENILDPVVLLPDLQVDRARIDATRARTEGVEVTLMSDPEADDFLWWASYGWSQSRDRRAEGYVPRGWDQTHTLKGGVNWDWRQWNLSAAATVHTGWPRTAILVETVPDGAGGTTFDIALGPQNNTRYSIFHSLDLRASRNIDVAIGELNAFIEITNAINRKNPCCTEFERYMDESGNDRLRLQNRNWLPLVPSVGVLWTF